MDRHSLKQALWWCSSQPPICSSAHLRVRAKDEGLLVLGIKFLLHTDRHGHRQACKETGRQTKRKAGRWVGRKAGRQTVRKAGRQTGRKAVRQADRKEGRQIDREEYRQARG